MFTYKTKIRIKPDVLKDELAKLLDAYNLLDPSGTLRKTKKADNFLGATEARSAFSKWNNLNHFYERIMQHESPSDNIPILKEYPDGSILIEVVAAAQGNSTRVYFKPSVTSLTKEVRKAIVPVQDGNVFIYTDIKAAEFALRAVQAQDQEAINEYLKGGDIYMHFASIFPPDTPRKTIKTILIADMYGKTAYSVSKDLGCSEGQATYLLNNIARMLPKFTMLKRKISAYAQRNNGYFAPRGFAQSDLVKVASVNPAKGFDNNLAWSAYTQSALGFCMQQFSLKYLEVQRGVEQTFLSIFDSVIAEIKPESQPRFEEFFKKQWSPLLPDGFHMGTTMYQAMYE